MLHVPPAVVVPMPLDSSAVRSATPIDVTREADPATGAVRYTARADGAVIYSGTLAAGYDCPHTADVIAGYLAAAHAQRQAAAARHLRLA